MNKKTVRGFMRKKIWKIPVYVLIVALVTSVATAGVMYSLKIPSTIKILQPAEDSYEIKIYEDSECTTEVTSFDFGSVALGGNSSVHFYVKSLSMLPVNVDVDDDPRIPYTDIWLNDYGTASLTHSWLGGPLEPNEVREITLTLEVWVEATEGTYNFDLVFKVYPA